MWESAGRDQIWTGISSVPPQVGVSTPASSQTARTRPALIRPEPLQQQRSPPRDLLSEVSGAELCAEIWENLEGMAGIEYGPAVAQPVPGRDTVRAGRGLPRGVGSGGAVCAAVPSQKSEVPRWEFLLACRRMGAVKYGPGGRTCGGARPADGGHHVVAPEVVALACAPPKAQDVKTMQLNATSC